VNFLQLCQELVKELGLGGSTGPTSVEGQQGELANAVRWIRDSCLDIDNMWQDWKYLHFEYLGLIQLNTRVPTPPNTPAGIKVRKWDRDSLILNFGSLRAKPLIYEEWSTFRKLRMLGSAGLSIDEPVIFSVKPDETLITYPTANATYPLQGEAWRRPPVLTLDTDVPLMPEEYHRIILANAAIKYANREDAPEVIAGMEAEFIDKLEKLESDQAPGFSANRQSSQDIILEGAIPGEEF
jgi:hypothetical protein